MKPADVNLLPTLADFRYALRQFLHFSEVAAVEAGIHPQQHQLMLQVAGAPAVAATTVAYVAERLGLKHNSAVELVNRSEHEGLVRREEDPNDRRRAIVRLTQKGDRLLDQLSGDHVRELMEMAPRLIDSLERISRHAAEGQ